MPNLFSLSLCVMPSLHFFTFYRHVQKKRTESKNGRWSHKNQKQKNSRGSERVWVYIKVTPFQLGFMQKSIHNCCLHSLKMSTWQSVKSNLFDFHKCCCDCTFQWLLLYMSLAQNILKFWNLYWSRWHFERLWSNINY